MLIDLSKRAKQKEFAEVIGVSESAVSDMSARGVITVGAPLGEWIKSYCAHLREQAAGRIGAGSTDLVAERARLAKEQADKIAYQNAQTRKELAPTYLLEEVLTKTAVRINGILEAIPGLIKRRVQALTAVEIEMVTDEIAKARNMVATMNLSDLFEEDEKSDDSDVLEDAD